MIETIYEINKIVETGKFYACWSGVSMGVDNAMIRADMLFLNVVFKHEKETYFRRIRGHKSYGNCGPHILWTLKRRYRINSGDRKGMIVAIEDVMEEETFIESGVSKVLRKGVDSKRISPSMKGDKVILNLLGNIEEHLHVDNLSKHIPDLYLTCKPNNTQLHLRRIGKVHKMLATHPGYDPNTGRDNNLNRLKKDYQIPVGKDRVGYPFNVIYGGGVITAAIDSKDTDMLLGQWYSMHQDSLAIKDFGEGVSIEGDLQDALNSRPDNT